MFCGPAKCSKWNFFWLGLEWQNSQLRKAVTARHGMQARTNYGPLSVFIRARWTCSDCINYISFIFVWTKKATICSHTGRSSRVKTFTHPWTVHISLPVKRSCLFLFGVPDAPVTISLAAFSAVGDFLESCNRFSLYYCTRYRLYLVFMHAVGFLVSLFLESSTRHEKTPPSRLSPVARLSLNKQSEDARDDEPRVPRVHW